MRGDSESGTGREMKREGESHGDERRYIDVPAGSQRSRDAKRRDRALLHELVDVVVQCAVEGQRRFVREVSGRCAL